MVNSLSELKNDMNLRFEQVDKRFDTMESKITSLQQSTSSMFDNLRGEMQSQFKWIMGVVITGIIIPVIYNLIPLISG